MNTKASNWKNLFLLLFVIAMPPACSGSEKNEDDSSSNELLIGSWKEENQAIEWFEWTFRRDGTCDLFMYYKNQISKDFENAKYSYNAQAQKLTIVYRDKGETETMIADVTMLTKSKFQYRWVDYEDEMDLYSFTKIDES